jgi:hypothetical protein
MLDSVIGFDAVRGLLYELLALPIRFLSVVVSPRTED